MSEEFEWQFGGWLQSLPPALAWGLLAAVAVAGGSIVVWLYRRTLKALPPRSRWVLTGFRLAMLLAVLFVLANPSRVRRSKPEVPGRDRHLAVLVDRSASMQSPDNRNETRLGNAVERWEPLADGAARVFGRVDYRRFSSGMEAAGSLHAATTDGEPGEETHLWQALGEALEEGAAGVVCLTDGLDTTGAGADAALVEAQQRGVPVYFVAASNRSRPTDLMRIRDVSVPSQVLRRSKFQASAVMEISARQDRDVPVELWADGRRIAGETIRARSGWNVVPWSVEVAAGEPGRMPLEFRLGDGERVEIAESTVRVADRTKVEVLYYQGALQWGFRFLREALESDPGFEMTSILNPALGVKIRLASSERSTLPDLPETAAELSRYRIVVLANVFADQLTARQQQALEEYAKGGGGVLFVAPAGESTHRFAGTVLEEMLPVVFDEAVLSQRDLAARRFQQGMSDAWAQEGDDGTVFGSDGRRQNLPVLLPFQLPRGSQGLLKPGQDPPMFCNYAPVRRVKGGAEILATHPTARTREDTQRVLLARQRYGAGFTAALATDLLWRWKMAIPSTSRAVETFWQQLILSLAPASGEGLRVVVGDRAAPGRELEVSILGGSAGKRPPAVTALAPDGGTRKLRVEAADEGWRASLKPATEGRWELTAIDDAGNRARVTMTVGAAVRTAETSDAPADVAGMRRIAEATGGALIDRDFVFRDPVAAVAEPPETKTARPVWDETWIFGLLLGIYAAELVARRRMRLL